MKNPINANIFWEIDISNPIEDYLFSINGYLILLTFEDVIVYNKKCNANNLNKCSTSVNDNETIGQELKLAILRKAAELKLIQTEKEVEKNRKKIGPDDPYQTGGN